MTLAVVINASAVPGASWWLLCAPILLLLIAGYFQPQPSRRRLFVALLLVAVLGVALIASDDQVMLAPCETCKLIDTSTWSGWVLWWGYGCNWC